MTGKFKTTARRNAGFFFFLMEKKDYGLRTVLPAFFCVDRGIVQFLFRIGEWKARIETRMTHIEGDLRKTDAKIDELNKSVNRLNELLAVLTERLESKRRKKER